MGDASYSGLEMTAEMWENGSFASPSPGLPLFPLMFNDSDLNDTLFNSTNSTAPDAFSGPSVAGVLIPLIYIIVCIIGLGGNTLVIHIVLHYSKIESVTNIYILNLAIADELFMLGLPFLAVQNTLQSWPFGSFMCRLVMTVDSINQFTSIFCLTVMSIDRYLAVVHPIRSSKWRRPQVAKVVNGTVWALSFLVVLPVVIFANIQKAGGTCNIAWPQPANIWRAAFIIYTSTVGFFCPLLIICLCYLLIVFKIRSSGKKVHATSTKRRKSERKVTRMVVIVVAVFVFCWLPFYALNIINLLVALPPEYQGLYYFVVVLGYANSCANPIVYGFLSDNFKRGFRKALCRSTRKVENHEPLEHQQQDEGRRALMPRESLRRAIRDEEDDDEEVVSEMTEIYRIAQNGNSSYQLQSSQPLFLEKGATPGVTELASPDRRDNTGDAKGKDANGATLTVPLLLNGTKSGSTKTLPEENLEPSASLEISYL
ncbi:somatostatin receptor type 5 isoform X3 [Oreochromis niloticus]|nr:somatostatin receptor type 5 isoform X3 [Oreochromis niloticus]XP_005469090.1 somatostatin receptor type 5 isoform X3 [Oreochromis niloticus]XP_025762212.1 somatostatin receptor type 5 isoform X3 [Oreochromis niloticus]UVK71178.1 somatostatin receptor type-3a [Oreochromis niloticus]